MGVSPAEVLMRQPVCTSWSFLKPCLEKQVHQHQENMKYNHDRQQGTYFLTLGVLIQGHNFVEMPKWLPGTVIKATGSKELESGSKNSSQRISICYFSCDSPKFRVGEIESTPVGACTGVDLSRDSQSLRITVSVAFSPLLGMPGISTPVCHHSMRQHKPLNS